MRAPARRQAWGAALAFAFALVLPAHVASGADQMPKVPRIGFLEAGGRFVIEHLTLPLQKLGYVDGKNIVFEFRGAEGKPERLPELAAELVRLKVDVIVAHTNIAAFAARDATSTIPIVVWAAHGALDTGLVRSLARPGGNLTGVESMAPEIDAKRVQLLKELVPGLSRLGALYNAGDQSAPFHVKSTQAAAHVLGVAVVALGVRRNEDFDTVFSTVGGKPLDGLLMFTDVLTWRNFKRTTDFAQQERVPTMCEFKELVVTGCLLSYGPTFAEISARTAEQIDKILKGAKPGDLPMERVTRFEMVVNAKTAKALGLTIPRSVLLRADQVIE